MNHQLNRLTGGTDITQPTHSLVQNIISARRYKYSVGSPVTYYTRSITAKRNKDILSAITANRAFDINPIPSKRAFRGMAGLAVLYPCVVDYIGQAVKDSPVCLLGDFRGYSVNLCRWLQLRLPFHPSGSLARLGSHRGIKISSLQWFG